MIRVHTIFPVNENDYKIIEFEDEYLRISSDEGVLILHSIRTGDIEHIFNKNTWRMAHYYREYERLV